MHVARRIDSFRVTLEALGRTDAAARMFNWNDRFRGFVRYANQLHDEGVLDVIVATGDLYDYLFERGDDRAGGGNAEFLRRLLLGQAPGPHFPDVEELRVPIFTVPGNHDYRVNPYELIFNIDLGKVLGERLVKNYGGYHLAWDDALALVTGRNGNDGDDVPDRGIDSAATDARRRHRQPAVPPVPGRRRVLRRRARPAPHRHARQLVGRRRRAHGRRRPAHVPRHVDRGRGGVRRRVAELRGRLADRAADDGRRTRRARPTAGCSSSGSTPRC